MNVYMPLCIIVSNYKQLWSSIANIQCIAYRYGVSANMYLQANLG